MGKLVQDWTGEHTRFPLLSSPFQYIGFGNWSFWELEFLGNK
jgi:hypothetical protein